MADHLLSDLAGNSGGVKSVHTDFIDNIGATTGTGEDLRYYDITLSPAVVVAKCVAFFQGSCAQNTGDAGFYTGTAAQGIVCARITTTTNLRLSFSSAAYPFFTGRWYVVEYY